MAGYTKLFSSIVNSTIWREPHHIRLVWITMLAIADKNGTVEASIPGLADLSRVTLKECEEAIERFKAPDKYSRNTDFGGRRIDDTTGGWLLLNHDRYREQGRIEDERERKRRWWRENRGKKTLENIKENRELDATSADSQSLAKTSFPDPSPSPLPAPNKKGSTSSPKKVTGVPIWEAYEEEFISAYPVDPMRNAGVNSVCKKIVEAVGVEEGVKLVKYYFKCENPYYKREKHPISALLKDIQKLRIEMKTGATDQPSLPDIQYDKFEI